MLVTAMWLCSIVCSVANAFGAVGAPENNLLLKKEKPASQMITQLAEKAESETDTKHPVTLFVIQTAVHDFWLDRDNNIRLESASNTRLSASFSPIPIYLARRTLRL